MNTKFFKTALLLLFAFSIFSCSKDDDAPAPTPVEKTVYVAGSEKIQGKDVATLWKNDIPTRLTDGSKNAKAIKVVANGQDIYVLIKEDTDYKVLKNGTSLYTLIDCTKASGLFVVGNDVYVSGKFVNFAKYWKNNVQVNVSQGAHSGDGLEIVVISNKVYVAGIEIRSPTIKVAMLWNVGQQEIELSANNGVAVVSGMCVYGNDYYISGKENGKGKVWKNGSSSYTTSQNGYLGAITANENGVFSYGIGFDSNSGIGLYKNNNFTELAINFEPNSIFVSGNDVYMTGAIVVQTNLQNAVYKNGVLKNYGTIDDLSTTNSIYVQ